MATLTTTSKIVEQGNFDAYFQKRVGGKLEDEVVHVTGLMSIEITHTEEVTDFPADDNPEYFSLKAPLTAEGTITILSMKYSDYEKMYNLTRDSNNVMWLGGKRTADKVGFAFKTTVVEEDGTESVNMLSYPNARISLPSKSTVSVDSTGSTVTNVQIPFKAGPVFWEDAEGNRKRATVGIINSKDDSEVWSKLSDHVFEPNEILI